VLSGENDVPFFSTPICFCRDSCFIYAICIYVYWCPTRFPCKMMFVSFNSNTTGFTCWAGTANTSGAHEFTLRFLWGWCCSIISVMFVDNCFSFFACPLHWPTWTPEVTPVFYGVRFAQCWVFCAVFCRWLFVLFRLVIVLFDLLRITPSDNPHWYLIDFRAQWISFFSKVNKSTYLPH
jgi:hypothetical protein